MLMVDFAGREEFLAQRQVALQYCARARAKLDVAVLLRLGAVCIPPQDAGDLQGSTGTVATVCYSVLQLVL